MNKAKEDEIAESINQRLGIEKIDVHNDEAKLQLLLMVDLLLDRIERMEESADGIIDLFPLPKKDY